MPLLTPKYEFTGISAYLLSHAEISSRVGTRVYGDELPGSEASALDAAIETGTEYGVIVIGNAPGLSGSLRAGNASNLQVGIQSKIIKCYAETPYRARLLFDYCRVALRELTRGRWGGVLLYSATVTGPSSVREEDTDWPLCFGYFDIMAELTA